MSGRLQGRTALVTGGARGIGAAICTCFSAEGAKVAVADIDTEGAAAMAATLSSGSFSLPLDVANVAACRAGVTKVIEEFGHLDILVNNAGYLVFTTAQDCDEETWDRLLAINLRGPFFCAQAVMPHMQDRGKGVIINMSSLAAKNGGIAAGPPYSAAKAGVSNLTVHLARILAPHGVRVNAIAPGVIDTQMTRGLSPDHAALAQQIPLGSKGHPEDVARCALFLASDDATHITGEIVDVNGGLHMD
ncbi:MAG TPA: SDR family NAD(P)-dependent oxidoreductase [Candidatus Latescibacteria bacterium]|jgi:3-oxoacyl-[acyl-carrier protein] reductase|nr:short-chain dehydrogenase [Gemmatimonadota bacterium]MDP7363355.1 SDR family NAD(P)-dependent oxidoreductase [Candidatus Latescibacterota bacterium]MDP7632271.1 SDR family NAD(P)-dependent oxidoreductase [Candidatus Latescibacterota bacterium]HCV22037.1 short-chain dehydrogenase [Candidatus Latescibacterota bacterium]HJN27804.1 SDR family NAD(P)-dependent oxidoreductase [Candidatus Latescibacterota bacterium]